MITGQEAEAMDVLNYGGGFQTIAAAILIKRGVLPRPDRIVCADTGREARSTWDYLDAYTRPLLATVGLAVEVAPHSLATVDLYAHNGDLLLPVFTETGKFSAYCSGEWKKAVVQRYLRGQGVGPATVVTNWIGYAWDERRRIRDNHGEGCWLRRFPLVELGLTKADCRVIIADEGLPTPVSSSCWMCPHRSNAEWRHVRDNLPEQWQEAIALDEAIREDDQRHAVYLHQSRIPLWRADLDAADRKEPNRQCSLGLCMV
jgi:hypothetical protein